MTPLSVSLRQHLKLGFLNYLQHNHMGAGLKMQISIAYQALLKQISWGECWKFSFLIKKKPEVEIHFLKHIPPNNSEGQNSLVNLHHKFQVNISK